MNKPLPRRHSFIVLDGPDRAPSRAMLYPVGFKAEDFARLHPGGALGRRLLLRVRDVMVTERLPALGVWGGDGTYNEAARGMVGSDTALIALPVRSRVSPGAKVMII